MPCAGARRRVTMPARSPMRARIEALRAGEEVAVMTPVKRDAILTWLDAAEAAVALWPVDSLDFAAIAERLAAGYGRARRHSPADWSLASAEDLHDLRGRV